MGVTRQTVNRIGHDAFAAHVEAMMHERWATGPEPVDAADAAPVPAIAGSTGP